MTKWLKIVFLYKGEVEKLTFSGLEKKDDSFKAKALSAASLVLNSMYADLPGKKNKNVSCKDSFRSEGDVGYRLLKGTL